MIKKKGQAMVEMLLVLCILLLLLCTIIDFGRILYTSIQLNMVSQEAVRLSGLGKKDIEVMEFINNKVELKDEDTLLIKISPADYQKKPGDYVTIIIIYKIKYITPFAGGLLPAPFEISSESTIRVE
jgi:hypothetical protein